MPSVAEEEYRRDPVLIHGIFDHRNLKAVLDIMNQGEAGGKILKEHPEMMRILDVVVHAQNG